MSVTLDTEAATIRLGIKDAGPGIKPELLPHLFERFVAEGPARGLGLGLYLARRIALAHGGSLEVNSQLGSGSEFSFLLPLAGPSGI
jgi:signal transduction histidine kinase